MLLILTLVVCCDRGNTVLFILSLVVLSCRGKTVLFILSLVGVIFVGTLCCNIVFSCVLLS